MANDSFWCCIGTAKYNNIKCEGKTYADITLIDENWDPFAQEDNLVLWEHSERDYEADFRVGYKEDVIQIFDDNGFDTNGFDRRDLNSEGMHFIRMESIC